jgi:hypothetical protein
MFMNEYRNRFTRSIKYPAHPSAAGGCDSLWETQNRQQLMGISVAPCIEICRVSTQKSAEGIVVPTHGTKARTRKGVRAFCMLRDGVEADTAEPFRARYGEASPLE